MNVADRQGAAGELRATIRLHMRLVIASRILRAVCEIVDAIQQAKTWKVLK